MVVNEEIRSSLLSEFFQRVGPENIAHQAVSGGLAETVNLYRGQSRIATNIRNSLAYTSKIIQGLELRTQSTVNAQELLVHNCR